MEIENIVANTVLLKAREGQFKPLPPTALKLSILFYAAILQEDFSETFPSIDQAILIEACLFPNDL